MSFEYCVKCEISLPCDGSFVTCNGCHSGMHFECTTIKISTYGGMSRARKDQWRCEFCRLVSKLAKTIPMKSDPNVIPALNQIKESIENVEKQVKECVEGQTHINTRYKELLDKHNDLIAKTSSLENKLDELVKLNEDKDSKINELMTKIHILEQESRNHDVVLYGLNDCDNDRLLDNVCQVGRSLNVQLHTYDVIRAYRIGRKKNQGGTSQGGRSPLPVVVSLASLAKREELLMASKNKNKQMASGQSSDMNITGKIRIFEMMSAYNSKLWKEARIKAAVVGWKYVWFTGGKIRVKKDDNGKSLVITTLSDINKME